MSTKDKKARTNLKPSWEKNENQEQDIQKLPRTIVLYKAEGARPDVFAHYKYTVTVNENEIIVTSKQGKDEIHIPRDSVLKYHVYPEGFIPA